jgi:hypothetical protein
MTEDPGDLGKLEIRNVDVHDNIVKMRADPDGRRRSSSPAVRCLDSPQSRSLSGSNRTG